MTTFLKSGNIPVLTITLIFILFSNPINASSSESAFIDRVHDEHICSRNAEWYSARSITIKTEFDDLKAKWEFKLFDNHDMILDIDQAHHGIIQKGKVLLVSGRALLTQGLELEEGYEIDIIDIPALTHQLAITLIDLAFPEGPDSLRSDHNKQIEEKTYPIKTTTASAYGLFRAPWKAEINLKKNKNVIEFVTTLIFSNDGNLLNNISVQGALSNFEAPDNNNLLVDSMNIVTWKQYKIGPMVREYEDRSIFDYGASPFTEHFDTIGKLREFITTQDKNEKDN